MRPSIPPGHWQSRFQEKGKKILRTSSARLARDDFNLNGNSTFFQKWFNTNTADHCISVPQIHRKSSDASHWAKNFFGTCCVLYNGLLELRIGAALSNTR